MSLSALASREKLATAWESLSPRRENLSAQVSPVEFSFAWTISDIPPERLKSDIAKSHIKKEREFIQASNFPRTSKTPLLRRG